LYYYNKNMRILIAADSFKDALPALAVCTAIAKGLENALPEAQTVVFPMADGGEGTADILTYHTRGETITCSAADPLGRPIEARYGLSSDGQIAFMEMAQASGLPFLTPNERNPMLASTYGTGQMIAHALDQGVKRLVLGIGGSATNDMGMGMLRALGYRFYDKKGRERAGTGADLLQVVRFEATDRHPGLDTLQVDVICDVDNPLYGPKGAAYVYARQKGADDTMIGQLDRGLRHFNQVIIESGRADTQQLPGAGAAGGLGAALHAFLGGNLRPGIQTVMEYTRFADQLKGVDYVITGEGKLDAQTLHGKLIQGITQKAQERSIPVIALCGALLAPPHAIAEMGLQAAFSIQNRPVDLPIALAETAKALERTAFMVGRML
jgi:glycerate kinase